MSRQKFLPAEVQRLGPYPQEQQAVIAKLNELADATNAINSYLRERNHRPMSDPPATRIWATLPMHPTKRPVNRELDTIDSIVIHHGGVNAVLTPQRVAQYHTGTKGWPTIAYTFMVSRAGNVAQTLPLEWVGYHSGDKRVNLHSIGILLDGLFMGDNWPTQEQIWATNELLSWVFGELSLAGDDVIGHQDVVNTACPGSTWEEWRDEIIP